MVALVEVEIVGVICYLVAALLVFAACLKLQ